MTASGSHDASSDSTTGATQYQASGGGGDDRSLGELLGDIANNMTTLVKDELQLAKQEAKEEAAKAGKKAGKGAGLLAGAGVTGHLALVFASLALMFLLDSWMHTAWAALIVTVIWGIVAAVLAAQGRKELKQMNPPQLETTQKTIKEDVQWAKQQKSS